MDFSSYLNKHFSRKTQNTRRKKDNRLNNLGEIRFEKLDPKKLEQIFRIHDKRWQRKVGNSEFSEGTTKMLFSDLYINTGDHSFKTTIDTLLLNDKIIAFVYGFTCRGRYIFFRIAHDDDFYLFSPGERVLKEKVKECFVENIRIFDFCAGYEPYKAIWAENIANINSLFFHNNTFVPILIFRMNKFLVDIKELLKSNKNIWNFRKYTLGKIKYKFSRKNILENCKKVRKKGRLYLLSKIIGPFYRREECLILYSKLKVSYKLTESKPPYTLAEATINDLEAIVDITTEKASSIIRRLANGHKFFWVKIEGKIICHFWLGPNIAEIEKAKSRKDISENATVIYDIGIIHYRKLLNIIKPLLGELMGVFYTLNYEALYVVLNKKQGKLYQCIGYKDIYLKEKIIRRYYLGKCFKKI